MYYVSPSRRTLFLLLPVLLTCMLALTGCLGKGDPSTTTRPNAPEEAVRGLVAEWTGSAHPLLAQTTATQTITFRDINRTNSWTFDVIGVEFPVSGIAHVYTRYRFGDVAATTVNVRFELSLYEGRWVFENFVIETLPSFVVTGTGVQGYITDAQSGLPVQNAAAALYQGDVRVAETLTDANGYYYLEAPAAGTYTLIVAKDGFEFLTVPNVTIE
ncbi:MAG TPA: carboxypeptidase-like regulatory domain-containing protein [Candidatus Ozemobacteraceae bacterium]|nr:carboxypeptidase-like regulatory domain-containing protein [Candidatus Ozemobacteraceae bacterium]